MQLVSAHRIDSSRCFSESGSEIVGLVTTIERAYETWLNRGLRTSTRGFCGSCKKHAIDISSTSRILFRQYYRPMSDSGSA
jgi:hypothetical protein